MSSREEMLIRVRQALGRSPTSSEAGSAIFPAAGKILTPIPPGELVEHFEAELIAVAGTAHRAGSAAELQRILLQILPPVGEGPIVFSRNPLLSRLDLAHTLETLNYAVTRWPGGDELPSSERVAFRTQCFSASVGITGVDFALAESGTLVLSSAAEGSQLASLAPPVHVALYVRHQVLESLEEVLRRLQAAGSDPSDLAGRSVVFITGPSRTSDIEQVSIRGVHGPTHVHAVLIEDVCIAEANGV